MKRGLGNTTLLIGGEGGEERGQAGETGLAGRGREVPGLAGFHSHGCCQVGATQRAPQLDGSSSTALSHNS